MRTQAASNKPNQTSQSGVKTTPPKPHWKPIAYQISGMLFMVFFVAMFCYMMYCGYKQS